MVIKLKEKGISTAVIKRLPRYYRYLGELIKNNREIISSKALSVMMGVTASQIRQDLNCFGGFGQQGYGYDVKTLHAEIGSILGLDRGYKTILIGAGHLGHALANHTNFSKRGFTLCAIFDSAESIIGSTINGITVQSPDALDEFVSAQKPDIAILALPKSAVESMANRLVGLGIKGIWNFSYTELQLPDNVAVENVHLSDSLMTLSYKLTENNK